MGGPPAGRGRLEVLTSVVRRDGGLQGPGRVRPADPPIRVERVRGRSLPVLGRRGPGGDRDRVTKGRTDIGWTPSGPSVTMAGCVRHPWRAAAGRLPSSRPRFAATSHRPMPPAARRPTLLRSRWWWRPRPAPAPGPCDGRIGASRASYSIVGPAYLGSVPRGLWSGAAALRPGSARMTLASPRSATTNGADVIERAEGRLTRVAAKRTL